MDQEILTVPEMARFLKISRSKAYRLVEEGEIPVLRIGRSVRIIQSDLLNWIEGKREDCTQIAHEIKPGEGKRGWRY
jgi:excisionase family DNA binding protein